jgi:hypothetical protein
MKNVIALLLFFITVATLQLNAQATLSIQGTIQKTSGVAIEDGSYPMTFKLYATETGGSAIWTENQTGIQIASGVYSALLGSVEPLNVPFNTTYYLGVSVDAGAELAPRARLTSAPYALSLLGQSNVFPSTGAIGAGTASPQSGTQLHVKNGSGDAKLLMEGSGAAVLDLKAGSNTGEVKLNASGNLELNRGGSNKVTVDANKATFNGDVELAAGKDLLLGAGSNLKYGSLDDWRLVDMDDFSTGDDGWDCQNSWNVSDDRNVERMQPMNTPFSEGWLIGPATTNSGDSDDVLYKQFDLSAHPHTMVKVVFTYHVSGSYDAGEVGFAAFSTVQTPSGSNNNNGNFQIGWVHNNDLLASDWFNGLGYVGQTNSLDYGVRGEMIAQTNNPIFYVLIGTRIENPEPLTDERYYISNVEVWVK